MHTRFVLAFTLSLLASFPLSLPPIASAGTAPSVGAFFKPAEIRNPGLSPSGKHLAFIVSKDDELIIVVRRLSDSRLKPIVKFTKAAFRPDRLRWANDDRLLISGAFVQYTAGLRASANQLYGVDRDGKNLKYLGKKWRGADDIQTQDNIIHMLPDDRKHVLLSLRKPNESSPSVYRLNVYNGSLRRVQHDKPHIMEWIADEAGDVRIGIGSDPPNVNLIARAKGKRKFETIFNFDSIREGSTQEEVFSVLGFTRDPDTILVSANRPSESDPEADRSAIYEYSLKTKEFGKAVLKHDWVDIQGRLITWPGTREPAAIQYTVERPELHFLDDRFEAFQRGLDAVLIDRTNTIVDETNDGRILLVRSSSSKVPPEVYVVTRDELKTMFLFSEYPELQGVALGEPRPISYLARDGLTIHGYLTLPPGSPPGKNLPAVLLPHGGPWSRDSLVFNAEVQFLASRGYAVLQMNFRGSTGYGAAHETRAYKRFGLEMQDDITDGAAWLVEQGIADADRIGIFGSSYGGYAALMAAVKTPDVFRCAAGYAGVYDLVAQRSRDRRYIGGKLLDDILGSDRKLLKAASPTQGVDKIRIPVLLGHGREDSNVHVSQSEKMAKALRRADKQVELVIYNHEIHGFAVGGTAIDFYTRLEKFLALHLAPR